MPSGLIHPVDHPEPHQAGWVQRSTQSVWKMRFLLLLHQGLTWGCLAPTTHWLTLLSSCVWCGCYQYQCGCGEEWWWCLSGCSVLWSMLCHDCYYSVGYSHHQFTYIVVSRPQAVLNVRLISNTIIHLVSIIIIRVIVMAAKWTRLTVTRFCSPV